MLFLVLQNLYAQTTKNTTIQPTKDLANPYNIDYRHLDSKYYPYIHTRNKFYDKDIANIIHDVDAAEKKNAFFIGMVYGVSFNMAFPLFGNPNIIGMQGIKHTAVNFSLFGLRAGYQKYTGNVFPINRFGYQIYIDFCVDFGRNGLFFTGMNADMLWDFLNKTKYIAGMNLGVGLGGAKITGLAISPYGDKYEAAYRINLGISMRYPLHHHKVGIYFGSVQGLERGFFSYTATIGYDYVF